MLKSLLHRWLRIPYALNVRYINRPKRPRATVLLIHGLGEDGDTWQDVVKRLPDDLRIVVVDLLGFGDSPKPEWAVYSAKTQARSVLATFLRLRITTPVIVVGHSMGALVAIEIAKRYSLLVSSLILVSPPLYDTTDTPRRFRVRRDNVLLSFYRMIVQHPQHFMRLSKITMKSRLLKRRYRLTDDNIDSYMAALETMIINQNSYDRAHRIRKPIRILHGVFDPLVVSGSLRKLTKINPNIQISSVPASHEIRGPFIGAVVKTINEQLAMH